MTYTFASNFKITDKVFIDGDQSIVGYVTGLMFASNGMEIRVAYVHNGDSKSNWIEEWRISSAD